MARPKSGEGEKTAKDRIEEAFWALLAEMPYQEVTCKELRARAGVSHNTFYYHFRSMEDLAEYAFGRLAVPEVTVAVMGVVVGGASSAEDLIARVPDFDTRLYRMRLLVSSGSPFLVGLLRTAIERAWLLAAGADEDRLTSEDRLDIDFALGGIVALFASDQAGDPKALAAFSQRRFGRDVASLLEDISRTK